MIYYVMCAVFVIATGIVLSRYELVKARRERRERRERLRDRARRCVRSRN